jgi:molybdenum cofactor cytidylyltransferase
MAARPTYPVAAILLAAGSSRRFGADNKLLASIEGVPLVRRAALALRASRVDAILAVTGPDAAEVEAALAGLGIRFVANARHGEGLGGSIAAGVRALGESVAGALIAPGDMPALDQVPIDALLELFAAGGGDIVVYPALPDGSQRNPVIWPRRLFPRLAALAGDRGAKPLLAECREDCRPVRVASAAAFVDIDTAGELDAYRRSRGDGGEP